MTSFGWLHLTDLHMGMAQQTTFLPTIKDKFFSDLKYLYEESMPWDLVVFTGDLTQKGQPDEFKRLDDFLDELWNKLGELGEQPSLVAVPGNHDLVRFKKDHDDPYVKLLTDNWERDKKIRETFWTNPDSEYRKRITAAFQNYVEWWERTQFKPPIQRGILPGDFSAVIEKDGASFGIVGLNSTFLQLTSEIEQGSLAIDPRQFHEVCGGNGPAWTKNYNACLLLTHQPPNWLNKESYGYLQADIAGNNNFAVHLFGHMHDVRYESQSVGGAPRLRVFQNTSLFGLAEFGEEEKLSRRHGYSAGNVQLKGEEGALTFWPRTATDRTGQWNFVVDTGVYLQGEQTESETFKLNKPLRTAPVSVTGKDDLPTTIEAPPNFKKRHAVLVGINDYVDFTKLKYCRHDVMEIAQSFRDVLKFDEVLEIHEEAKVRPDRDSILTTLGELRDLKKIAAEDLFVFYFSGHGINEGGKDYLLPIGARRRDVKRLGIRVEELVELLGEFNCPNTMMFIDACREAVAGARGGAAIGVDTNALVSKANIVTFFSCGPTDRSYEIDALQHGSFTYCILQAIKEGVVSTVQELERYLEINVPYINRENDMPTQLPYAVVSPAASAALAILVAKRKASGTAEKYQPLVEKLTQLYADGLLEHAEFVSTIELLGRISEKVELETRELKKLSLIETLCSGVWKPAFFSTSWKEMNRKRVPGPQFRKPEPLR